MNTSETWIGCQQYRWQSTALTSRRTTARRTRTGLWSLAVCTRGRLPCALECKKSVQLDITRCNLPGCIDIGFFEESRSTNDPKLPNLKLDIVA